MSDKKELLRSIPAMDRVLNEMALLSEMVGLPHKVLLEIVRAALEKVRNGIIAGAITEIRFDDIREIALRNLHEMMKPGLKRVINATGVVLHTNLGRAPSSERAQAQVAEIMNGYSTLEYDLEKGERGSRYDHVTARITQLTGAEAALIVNNNAAAVLLTLTCLSKNKETVVSRGELVEIGGSFRIPEVMQQSGAILREVGTTNKTNLQDYDIAIGTNTACIFKVHTSNFRVVGFTDAPNDSELCQLAHRRGLLAINDLGSGTILSIGKGRFEEPTVADCVSAGYDVITFSGDKLLGACQAGLIVGKRDIIERMKKEPLLRALRIDKLSLAALEGTLIDYCLGQAESRIPVWTMLRSTPCELKETAQRLAKSLEPICEKGWRVDVVPTASLAGGGSLPAVELEGYGVAIVGNGMSASELERRLRSLKKPIIAIVRDDRVVFDVRCLGEDECALREQILEMAMESVG